MADITNVNSVPMASVVEKIRANLNNPSGAFDIAIDAIEEVTDGNVTFVDATNPTVLLLEVMSAASSALLTETLSLLRSQYPNLSETPEDLKPKMSEWDYVNVFCKPCKEKVSILLGWESLKRSMLRDEAERCVKAVIPRDTAITFSVTTFTLMYPIVIRFYDTGTLMISYDTDITSPFQSLTTNIVPYTLDKLPSGESFIRFEIEMLQLAIQPVFGTIQQGRVYKNSFTFSDQFFYARAFLRNSNTDNKWKEIKTTHSDLVYDRREPTIVLSVEGDRLTTTLPQIYLRNNANVGEIMVLVYTSRGDISENLTGIEPSFDLVAHNPDRDISDYTTVALSNVPRMAVSTAFTSGGTNGLTFEELRSRVIENSVGVRKTPITNVDIEEEGKDYGFNIVKNTDVFTNRIFLATKKLPQPTNKRLTTSANIGIETLVTDRQSFLNNANVKINGDRWVILPTCLFEQVNGVMSIVTPSEIQAIRQLPQADFLDVVNSRKFLYTPFHWVLDNSSDLFSSRPYYMDSPTISPINFERQNRTLALAVNTAARTIEKSLTGYVLKTRVESGNHFKNLGDNEVAVQLRYTPTGSQLPVYVLGRQIGIAENGEREFAFDLKTNFNINSDHQIEFLDAEYGPGYNLDIWTELEVKFELFICTSSLVPGYEPDASKELYGAFQLPAGFVPITHESVVIVFGQALENLWSRARPLSFGDEFILHEVDIPRLYPEDVYTDDPVTGRLFTIVNGKPHFEILHRAGDPVMVNGVQIYEFRKGDPVINPATGAPMVKPSEQQLKELDLLLIDGRHYFVNDPAYLSYNKELVNVLLSWITEDLKEIQKVTLDQTAVFFHPLSQLGECRIDRGDGDIITIPTEQSPVLELFVPENVFNDTDLRQTLETKSIALLDEALSRKEINKTTIGNELKVLYGNAVTSLRLTGIGGDLDIHYAKVVSPNKELSLKRILSAQTDGTFIIKEDVRFIFTKVK